MGVLERLADAMRTSGRVVWRCGDCGELVETGLPDSGNAHDADVVCDQCGSDDLDVLARSAG